MKHYPCCWGSSCIRSHCLSLLKEIRASFALVVQNRRPLISSPCYCCMRFVDLLFKERVFIYFFNLFSTKDRLECLSFTLKSEKSWRLLAIWSSRPLFIEIFIQMLWFILGRLWRLLLNVIDFYPIPSKDLNFSFHFLHSTDSILHLTLFQVFNFPLNHIENRLSLLQSWKQMMIFKRDSF